jgi:hypothetical protein
MFVGESDVNHNGITDFHDFAEIAQDWFEKRLWP